MRLVLGSISIVTELAGITLPQTITFNVHAPVNQNNGLRYDEGAIRIKAPRRYGKLAELEIRWRPGYYSHSLTLPSMTTSNISLQSAIALSTTLGSSLRCGIAEFTAPFSA